MIPSLRTLVFAHALTHRDVERVCPGITAPNAEQRALVYLRLLVGETEWSDGWERRLDDCFEMFVGAEVVCHLVRMAADEPTIDRLLRTHRNVGSAALDRWKESARTMQLL